MRQTAELLIVALELRLMARQTAQEQSLRPVEHPLTDRLMEAADALEGLALRSNIDFARQQLAPLRRRT